MKLFICEYHDGLLELLGESAAGDGLPYAASKWKRIRVVDVDALPPADSTEVEQHESQWLYHYARLQELRPDTRPDDAIAGELVRLRSENQQMRVTLTLAEWSALFELQHVIDDAEMRRHIVAHVLSPTIRESLVSAINKLRAQAYAIAPSAPETMATARRQCPICFRYASCQLPSTLEGTSAFECRGCNHIWHERAI